jgi:hypothetical protein
MKNTFIASIVMAIALLVSVQVIAMEREYYEINPENTNLDETRKINPHLNERNKRYFWNQIHNYTTERKEANNPNNTAFIADAKKRTAFNAEIQKKIDRYKSLYYGNKRYSEEEILAVLRYGTIIN